MNSSGPRIDPCGADTELHTESMVEQVEQVGTKPLSAWLVKLYIISSRKSNMSMVSNASGWSNKRESIAKAISLKIFNIAVYVL